jgi:opacity protein-like surface antigen
MNLRLKPFLAVAMFALGVVSTPALSQDAGWFIGGTGGVVDAKQGCPPVGAIAGLSCDASSTGWRAFGGYRFNAYFGYELGYADLGKVTQTLAGFAPTTFESTAIDVVLFVALPIGQDFSFFVKGGVFRWDLDVKSPGAATASSHGEDTTYGFGMHYNFTKSLALRLEWQRYNDIGDVSTTGQSHFEVTSVGLVLKF